MADRPEDLSLPVINVSQEARKVIAKTASVFVLYTTATAATLASKAGRKTMNANDVLEALMENEFPQLKEPLEKSLASFRDAQKKKKESTTARKSEQANKSTSKGSSPTSKKSPKQNNSNAAETVSISDSDGDE